MHAMYQAMNVPFADRDFYYGDLYTPPAEPIRGLLSKDYAKSRYAQISWDKNDPTVKPGDPYPFQGEKNPFAQLLAQWKVEAASDSARRSGQQDRAIPQDESDSAFYESFYGGTTSIQAADTSGWVVSVTPSGGGVPPGIAGPKGARLRQRGQGLVTDAREGAAEVIAAGKPPRQHLHTGP